MALQHSEWAHMHFQFTKRIHRDRRHRYHGRLIAGGPRPCPRNNLFIQTSVRRRPLTTESMHRGFRAPCDWHYPRADILLACASLGLVSHNSITALDFALRTNILSRLLMVPSMGLWVVFALPDTASSL